MQRKDVEPKLKCLKHWGVLKPKKKARIGMKEIKMKGSELSCTRLFTNEGRHAHTAGGETPQNQCYTRAPHTSAREVDILFVKNTAGGPPPPSPKWHHSDHRKGLQWNRTPGESTWSSGPMFTKGASQSAALLTVQGAPRYLPTHGLVTVRFLLSTRMLARSTAALVTWLHAQVPPLLLRTEPNLLGESHLRVPSAQPWGRLRLLIHLYSERWRLEPRALNALTAARRRHKERVDLLLLPPPNEPRTRHFSISNETQRESSLGEISQILSPQPPPLWLWWTYWVTPPTTEERGLWLELSPHIWDDLTLMHRLTYL